MRISGWQSVVLRGRFLIATAIFASTTSLAQQGIAGSPRTFIPPQASELSDMAGVSAINPRIKPIPLSQNYEHYLHEIPPSGTQEKYLKEIPIDPQGAPEASGTQQKTVLVTMRWSASRRRVSE